MYAPATLSLSHFKLMVDILRSYSECQTFLDVVVSWEHLDFTFHFLRFFCSYIQSCKQSITSCSFFHTKISLNFTWPIHVWRSRKRFTEKQAEHWWAENRARVYERYNVRVMDKSSIGIGSEELTHWLVQTATEIKSFCIWKTRRFVQFPSST